MNDVPSYELRANGKHAPGDPANPANVGPVKKLTILFHPELQQVGMEFDPKHDFKTWEFVIATLEMAKRHAEKCLRMAEIQQLQNAAVQQAQDDLIRRKLHLS